jgi:hypothetical protein
MIKRIIFVFCILIIGYGTCEAKEIYTIGRAPVFKNIGNTVLDMQECLLKNWGDVEAILSLGEVSHLSQQLNRAIRGNAKAGKVTTGKLYKGTKLQWMSYRHRIKPKGTIALLQDPVWAGKALDVFYITVYDGPVTYRFVIPMGCGNLSLMKIDKAAINISQQIKTLEYKSSVAPLEPVVKNKPNYTPWIVGGGALLITGLALYALLPPRVTKECEHGTSKEEEPPSGYIPSSAPPLYDKAKLDLTPKTKLSFSNGSINVKVELFRLEF